MIRGDSRMKLRTLWNKFIVETVGPYSTGLQLEKKFGLESAAVLNHIYKNKPTGENALGVWLDRKFVTNAIWDAIRRRKANISEALNDTLHEFFDKRAYSTVKICDLACGYSNYLVENLKHYNNDKLEIEFIDKDIKSQYELREPLRAFKNVKTSFRRSDITNDRTYDFVGAPDIMILSGYFDTICKDEVQIEYILRQVYKSLNPEGYFIFTTQNTNYNIKTIDELLFEDNSNKKAQKEEKDIDNIRNMAEITGFEILSEKVDNENRYCVYVAKKS
ncbi:MAG: hypothetical protein DKM23_04955 [Candidatus Melainabacteria bacterium]|nr:MAG: hypothetical protein DKM23_04955 [Candidatus Melainabacteria bacterium]